MFDVQIARQHGAQIEKSTLHDGMWIVCSHDETPFFWAYFDSEEDAARAFLTWENGPRVTYDESTGKD